MLDKIKDIVDRNICENLISKKWDIQFRNADFEQIYWHHHPMTERYYFEGNPLFTFELQSPLEMECYPIVMLRDGALGILDFFINYPRPWSDLKTMFLIPERFESLVPKFWKDHVAIYKVQSRELEKSSSTQLILFGNSSCDSYYFTSLEESLNGLSQEALENLDVRCLFLQRDSKLKNQPDGNDYIEKLKIIFQKTSLDLKITTNFYPDFDQMREGDFYYYNLDRDSIFISDNYLEHFFMARKGRDIAQSNSRNLAKEVLKYSLSPYHEVVISEFNSDQSVFPDFYLYCKLNKIDKPSVHDLYNNPGIMGLLGQKLNYRDNI